MSWWQRYATPSLILATIRWSIAGLLCWLLVSLVGWLGITIIGAATLLIAYRWSLDETNALPSYTTGANSPYVVQYERQFGHSTPEQKASDRAKAAELNRLLYLIRTIGLAL